MTRDTVGKISSELLMKEAPTRDPIELEREMHKEYEKNIYECIERGKKEYPDDFYVIVITKKERLMQNVLRHYFFPVSACPTPNYDQTVYKYYRNQEAIDFIWVIPSRETCLLLKDHALEVVAEEHGLLKFVLDFADGTLMKMAKQLNGEEETSPLLHKG